jgi:hypothetical protein
MSGDNPAGGPAPPQGGFDIAAIREQVARETLVQANIANPLLLVSEDRLRLRLQQFERAAETRRAWIGPAGVAFTLLANLYQLSSTGPEYVLMGLSREKWLGVNGCALVGALVWTIAALVAMARANLKANTVDAVVVSLRPTPRPPGPPALPPVE